MSHEMRELNRKNLKIGIAENLKIEFPLLNSKTQIVKTNLSRIEIIEKSMPELKYFKRETYFSRIYKAILNKKIEPQPVINPKNEEKIRTLYFKQFCYRYVLEEAMLAVCYDGASDTLYVRTDGYTDIDLRFLE